MMKSRSDAAANCNAKPGEIRGTRPDMLQTIISISQSVRALLRLRLADLGLANGQDEMLLAMEAGRPVPSSTLAPWPDMRPAQMARLLDPLIAKGLVETVGASRDPMCSLVQISPAGLGMRARVQAIWNEVGEELQGPDGGERGHRLAETLETMQAQIRSQLTPFR